jgi:hypothetical protein
MTYGRGATDGSLFAEFDAEGRSYFPLVLWTSGSVEVQFQHLKVRPPFDSESLREDFRQHLNTIPGVSLPDGSLARRPSFSMKLLRTEDALEKLLEVLDWFLSLVPKS